MHATVGKSKFNKTRPCDNFICEFYFAVEFNYHYFDKTHVCQDEIDLSNMVLKTQMSIFFLQAFNNNVPNA